MTREELIDHLEHLERYTHYSEDAPALREVIEMLKTHEERTETHACDCISRQGAIDAINSHFGFNIEEEYGSAVQEVINALPPAQRDHIAEVSKKVDSDLISRQVAIDAANKIIERDTSGSNAVVNAMIAWSEYIRTLPSAQPEITLESAIDYLHSIGWMQEHDRILTESAQPAPQWIPCSERLPDYPENNDYYLVTIQCEHHDGWDDYVTGFAEWTKHGWDELSCYIGQIKVIAWMPLPEPYREEE